MKRNGVFLDRISWEISCDLKIDAEIIIIGMVFSLMILLFFEFKYYRESREKAQRGG